MAYDSSHYIYIYVLCAYIYIYIHTHIHIHISIYTYLYIYICTFIIYIYVHIYAHFFTNVCIWYIHMKLFSIRVKRHSRKWARNANAKFKDCVFAWSFSRANIYAYAYIYVHIYEKLFSKTCSPNVALILQCRLLDWRLARFGKELCI